MDLVDRLHARLLRALEQEPHGADSARITIGDVYQRLVPYRAVRGEMGILELAEYEDALLRLLAGERGYIEVEDEDARLELQRELASTNPILGIYRDYAAAPISGVSRGPSSASSSPAPAASPETPGGAPLPGMTSRVQGATSPAAQSAGTSNAPPAAPAPITPDRTPRPSSPVPDVTEEAPAPVRRAEAMAPAAPGRCHRCGESLPDEPDLRFCPACGGDQREVPCARCGGRLRAAWKFCIRCGTPRPGIAARS